MSTIAANPGKLLRKAIAAGLLALILLGCRLPYLSRSQLRVWNQGRVDIEKLTVEFPYDSIEFGDVRSGQMTDYQRVPNGVYRYAAYAFEFNGQSKTQLVSDWFAETPVEGERFTYVLRMDPTRGYYEWIELVEVVVDE